LNLPGQHETSVGRETKRNRMLEILRKLRTLLYEISSYEIAGFQIDTALHLVGGFLGLLVLSRFFRLKTSVYIAVALILLKEVFDLFAKSRMEYIRPPHIDIIYDLVAGGVGVFSAWLFIRWRQRSTTSRRRRRT
jgi:hypothetical protein